MLHGPGYSWTPRVVPFAFPQTESRQDHSQSHRSTAVCKNIDVYIFRQVTLGPLRTHRDSDVWCRVCRIEAGSELACYIIQRVKMLVIWFHYYISERLELNSLGTLDPLATNGTSRQLNKFLMVSHRGQVHLVVIAAPSTPLSGEK